MVKSTVATEKFRPIACPRGLPPIQIGKRHAAGELAVPGVMREHCPGFRVDFGDGTVSSGVVTEWDPPRRVAFTWHPGREPESAQHVVVTFASTGEGTEETLVHGGWEKFGDGAAEAREGYGAGWTAVLEAYRAAL